MLDLSVIILTYNEELHIRRCLENVLPIAKKIYVIDCFSTDKTKEIASKLGAEVVEHEWPGNQAEQFNWALNNLPIDTRWVLRLDADEYLLPELVQELQEKLPTLPDDVTGIIFNRRHIFMGKWMRRGIYPVKLLRVFRYGKGMCEQRLMDEHIQLTEGRAVEFEHDFCDHNLNNLSWFCHKHKVALPGCLPEERHLVRSRPCLHKEGLHAALLCCPGKACLHEPCGRIGIGTIFEEQGDLQGHFLCIRGNGRPRDKSCRQKKLEGQDSQEEGETPESRILAGPS